LATPLRRSSLPVSPRRQRASFESNSETNHCEEAAAASTTTSTASSSSRRASFVSKATVFIDSASSEARSPQRNVRQSPVASNQEENKSEGSQSSVFDDNISQDCVKQKLPIVNSMYVYVFIRLHLKLITINIWISINVVSVSVYLRKQY
jgi:hypothetical protein